MYDEYVEKIRYNSNFDQKKLGEEFECNARKLFRGYDMLFT
jgi:hypothetical protein